MKINFPVFTTESNEQRESFVFSYAEGDVNGDFIVDYVYLIGQRSDDSPYSTSVTLVIQDGRTNQFHSVALSTDQGYEPRLFLAPFSRANVDDILISMDSGGSGGYGYYYLYSFYENQPVLLFDYDAFDRLYDYEVIYKNDYRIEVTNKTLHLSFVIDISNRDHDYLADLYHPDGTLKTPLEGSVSGLNQLYPIDFDGDGVYELYALQRIIGQYNADGLGLVQTPLSWDGTAFTPAFGNQYVAVLGVNQ
ncbi:VCBS repeat-containing protein [Halalkalibacter oceani]|uniref:VCBS repeat-containing protein n=1 Tax=Halalkalibacter oceani TaxID=1653776 RepID=UPI0033920ACF